jgi:hypothetical protein
MIRIASTLAALAVLSTITVPATAAVKIAPAYELELPDFMPDLKAGTIVILDQEAAWPAS